MPTHFHENKGLYQDISNMSRSRYVRRTGPAARLALSLGLVLAGFVGSTKAQNRPVVAPITSSPVRVAPGAPVGVVVEAPGVAVTAPEAPPDAAAPAVEGLPDDIQVIRFQAPAGVKVEVLGPQPEAVPQGDGKGALQVGLKVGSGYKLRISNIPDRPELELFPMIEIVGHLHRPANIDPGKFPVRVVFALEDLLDAADKGRLFTQVVYLEDPDQALPIKLGKDEPPSVMLNPAEDAVRVGAALGRVIAVVRIGGRKPTPIELTQPLGDGMATGGCPFTTSGGDRCSLPCGLVCGTPPPAGKRWLPRDEYLCDGGDRDTPLHFGGDGGLKGIDPRDALVLFRDDKRPRVLPTNTVCLYAPRFASVRNSLGANESLSVQILKQSDRIERASISAMKEGPKKLGQTAAAETSRVRVRPSGLGSRIFAGEASELRVLSGYDDTVSIAAQKLIQGPEKMRTRLRATGYKASTAAVTIQKGAGAVVTGIVEGASQNVMIWPARETVGVETPPNRPGISVIKQVSADQAEPGDTVTFTIRYKNMGNTPIKSVSIVDSLMPRLEYVPSTAKGPKGTVFTSTENKVGSLELRWDLPGTLAAGVEGYVEFQAVVR
jgi:uncharacterized repeat protein (TIGR01451 family)